MTPIRAVEADYGGDNTTISIIRFMDSAGNKYYEYNPNNLSWGTKTYQLGENEELIGVYGSMDKNPWFESFGFIVKVK